MADATERSLPIGSFYQKLYDYRLTGYPPEGWRMDVSTTAPGFGRAGGAQQLQFFDELGEAVSIKRADDEGVLEVLPRGLRKIWCRWCRNGPPVPGLISKSSKGR